MKITYLHSSLGYPSFILKEHLVEDLVPGGEQALVGSDHSESESLGGGERKETRKKYGSTISCIWGEAVDGMRILWRPYSQSYFWAEPPKIMLGQGVVSTT